MLRSVAKLDWDFSFGASVLGLIELQVLSEALGGSGEVTSSNGAREKGSKLLVLDKLPSWESLPSCGLFGGSLAGSADSEALDTGARSVSSVLSCLRRKKRDAVKDQ